MESRKVINEYSNSIKIKINLFDFSTCKLVVLLQQLFYADVIKWMFRLKLEWKQSLNGSTMDRKGMINRVNIKQMSMLHSNYLLVYNGSIPKQD